MFEEKIELVKNPKAMRTKPWVARVNLDSSEIEFLKPVEYKSEYTRVYEFENSNFYIVCSDYSSHKNKRVYYTLYLAADNKLLEIASIAFTAYPSFSAIDDEAKTVLKKAYNSADNNKTTTALIEVAKWYAAKFNINAKDVEDQVRQELAMICKKYNVTIQELIDIAKSF